MPMQLRLEPDMDIKTLFKKSVIDIKGYQSPPQQNVKAKLNQNENPFDVPVHIKNKLAKVAVELSWNRYPVNESPLLRQKLATRHDVTADQILLGNGSNQLLQTLLSATLNDNDKVCLSSPTFSLFSLFSNLYNAECLDIRQTQNFEIPYDEFIGVVKKRQPRVILLCSPNNPTGSEINLDFLRDICRTSRGMVFWDEAYAEFTDRSAIPLLPEHKNLVISRTFSKAFSLAGMRFGYLISNRAVIEQLEKVNLPYNVNCFTEAIVSELLDERKSLFERVGYIVEQRQRMFEQMSEINAIQVYPSKANFLLFKSDNARSLFQALRHKGVLVRDVSGYPLLQDHLRVNVGSAEENDYFLKIIKQG